MKLICAAWGMSLAFVIFSAAVLSSQTAVFDVATPPRLSCAATLTTGNTQLSVLCQVGGLHAVTTTVTIAAITGQFDGVVPHISTGGDSITMLIRRKLATDPLYVDVAANGKMAEGFPKTIPIP
jgi:hypothetical protein